MRGHLAPISDPLKNREFFGTSLNSTRRPNATAADMDRRIFIDFYLG